jgi:2,4-dienoyl-CoA reductase-like NADH-dependent reductase (Old Yellow Enzyme family)
MTDLSLLFQPFAHKGLTLSNRIVMAPMTRQQSPGGVPGAQVAEYYRKRAAHGVGLIVTEGVTVGRGGASNDVNVPNIHTAEALEGWRKVVSTVHDAGGKIAPQLWHVGMVRKPGEGPSPDAPSDGPSGLSGSGKQVGTPMTEEDIADTVSAFATAAKESIARGFDCVELHGAHGYLIDQFFWEKSNQRGDRYGGEAQQRTTFAAEIVAAVRAAIGPDAVIILRYSQWKQQDYAARLAQTPEELGRFLEPLVDAGVDIFHCSTRRFWEPEFADLDGRMNLAGWTKKLSGKPVITVGSIGLDKDFINAFRGEGANTSEGVARLADLVAMMERGEVDLAAVGRALISDPDWAEKIRDGRTSELTPFESAQLMSLV